MKDIITKINESSILEANESKDKTFGELKRGDKIYYVLTQSERYSKIFATTIRSYSAPYKSSIFIDIEKSKDDDIYGLSHLSIHINDGADKKLWSESFSWPDSGEFVVIATDRDLLVPLVDEKVDKKLESLKKELEKHNKEIDLINKEITRLIDVKNNKFTD